MSTAQLKAKYPFVTFDIKQMAKGLVGLYSPNEIVALRMGMNPSRMVELLRETVVEVICTNMKCKPDGESECLYQGEWIAFKPREIADDVVNDVVLETYNCVDMIA